MNAIRRTAWFFSLALMMACIMGVLGSIRGEALAGVIASHGTDGVAVRDADLGKLQAFLEQKIVLQKLTDYGVSAEEAMAKIRSMSDTDQNPFSERWLIELGTGSTNRHRGSQP